MNTLEMNRLLSRNSATKPYFLGTVSCDALFRPNVYPSFLVANTEESFKNGEHWLIFFFDKENSVELFDSTGRYPNACISPFLRLFKKQKINKNRLQSKFSPFCGLFCTYFAIERCKGRKFTEIVSFLEGIKSGADAWILNYFSR